MNIITHLTIWTKFFLITTANAGESNVEKLRFISFMAESYGVDASRSDSDGSYWLIAIGEASMRVEACRLRQNF